MKSVKLHPRKCDVTGEGMASGYCIGEGLMYIKYESDMINHLRLVEEEGNPEYKEGEITDEWLLEDYYNHDYYYYTDWECPDDIQFVEVDGVMYEEGTDEFDKHFTPSWNKDKVTPESDYESLKADVQRLIKYMNENTTTLWRDDLECTHECVVLEDVHDGVKRDECDNPTMACTGTNVTTMIQHIQRTHLA